MRRGEHLARSDAGGREPIGAPPCVAQGGYADPSSFKCLIREILFEKSPKVNFPNGTTRSSLFLVSRNLIVLALKSICCHRSWRTSEWRPPVASTRRTNKCRYGLLDCPHTHRSVFLCSSVILGLRGSGFKRLTCRKGLLESQPKRGDAAQVKAGLRLARYRLTLLGE